MASVCLISDTLNASSISQKFYQECIKTAQTPLYYLQTFQNSLAYYLP